MTEFIIRPETEQDYGAIYNIHRAAFDGPDEAKLVNKLRDIDNATVSLVAEQNGQVVGHVLFSMLKEPTQALALAPIAVAPDVQKHGIGSALIWKGLEQARNEGWLTIFVLGSPDYYKRFGFCLEAAKEYTCCYSGDYFMVLHLNPEHRAKPGKVSYPAPFNELG
jgi:putative acetyltransferase